MNHRSHGFVQASLRHDWEFATDRRSGSIKKWFYPGDLSGEEFIHSTHTN
jgi:hypothetical protein